MTIGKVGGSVVAETDNLRLQKKVENSLNTNKTNENAKILKDSLVLSEKAKDLAAKQSGTQLQEEQSESAATEAKEAE